jgi:2-polyprenyl-6-methoxyphenol hydroxylase-like FAD-dependent oxidoreductase
MPGFRVIILGAGPVGLFTAHALAAAGIDFIVLEKQPEIVRHRGTLIVLWPPYLRLIDQLGLSKAVMKYSTPFSTKTNFTHSGEPLCGGHIFDGIEKWSVRHCRVNT